MSSPLPLIDMAPLLAPASGAEDARAATIAAIDAAAQSHGFFLLTGHGIKPALFDAVERQGRAFFGCPEAEKAEIAMAHGGAAWRGWFPLGGELTSGQPDAKEGLYLGEELGPDDPRVAARWPLHGANLWPAGVPGLRPAVEAWLAATTRAAHALIEGLSLALCLPADYFARHFTARPTLLFRIFRYPPGTGQGFGVGEHSDYGFLTLLAQDHHGGLEVKTDAGWISVPAVPGALVVNIGDMLDRLTGGRWRSAPHRVRNVSGAERLSWPLFFDPAFDARIEPLPDLAASAVRPARWDGLDLAALEGTYGEYLLAKVGRVFPDLKAKVRL